jgi:hypothetical protein
VACSRLLSDSERVSSGDQKMRRVKDQDEEGKGPGDQEDPGTRGPEDQATRGSRDQGTRGPGDQRIRGTFNDFSSKFICLFQGPRVLFQATGRCFLQSHPFGDALTAESAR